MARHNTDPQLGALRQALREQVAAAERARPFRAPVLNTDPTAPLDGDVWIVGTQLCYRAGGVTRRLAGS